MILRRFKLE